MSSVKRLKKKADQLWSKLILLKGSCEVCGKRENLNAHHIVGRRNLRLRYDLKNGVCLCAGHHTLRMDSAHQDPIEFMFWLMNHRPDDYNYLVENKETLEFNADYEEIIRELTQKLRELSSE